MTDVQYVEQRGTPRMVQPKLQPGATAAATWRVFRQRPWRFLGLAVIPFVPWIFVVLLTFLAGRSGNPALKYVGPALNILQYIIQFACQGAIIAAAARVANGQTFGVGQVLGVGARRILPILGIVLLSIVIVIIGFLLLIIPGIVLAVYMVLAVPASVIERLGPIAAFERSYALIKGNWWRVVGTGFLALILPFFALGAVMLVLAFGLGTSKLWAGLAMAAIGIPAFLVLTAVASIFYGVLFVELRTLKEGPSREAIAEVFS